MKHKIIQTLLSILLVIFLIISILNIRTTYAKYQEEVDTDYQVDIRKWMVLVNGKDIQNEETVMSGVISPILIENEHMKEGMIVPGREAYFEMDMDYTKVDVPFTYTFDIAQSNENKLSDLEFYGFSVVDEASGFQIDNIEDTITYIGMEEGTGTETINEETGEKTLQVIQEVINTETGTIKNIILTASLELPPEEAEPAITNEDDIQNIPGLILDSDPENVEASEEPTIEIVGKIAKVTKKVIDGNSGAEIEPERVIFSLTQNLDKETNKTTYTIIQPEDPTKLENYQRYENLRVYFRWADDEENQMDNLADTGFRGEPDPDVNKKHTLLNYEANLKFKQYVQE